MTRSWPLRIVLSLAVVVSACGGGDSEADQQIADLQREIAELQAQAAATTATTVGPTTTVGPSTTATPVDVHSVVFTWVWWQNVVGDETYASFSFGPEDAVKPSLIQEALTGLLGELGFPGGTLARMDITRALDGMQTATGDGVVASWTYHPDQGLSIVIERGS